MIDGIIRDNGTSRTIKGTLPDTYAAFKAAVEGGTQGLDVIFNAAGWSQQPTPLNKLTLLTDATASLIGMAAGVTDPATINEALAGIAGVIGTNGVRLAQGSYTGTGTYGASNPNTLTFAFAPAFVFIEPESDSRLTILPMVRGVSRLGPDTGSGSTTAERLVTWAGNSVSWYATAADRQHNEANQTYYYVAIG